MKSARLQAGQQPAPDNRRSPVAAQRRDAAAPAGRPTSAPPELNDWLGERVLAAAANAPSDTCFPLSSAGLEREQLTIIDTLNAWGVNHYVSASYGVVALTIEGRPGTLKAAERIRTKGAAA